jgi:hypothetical protein
VADHRLRASLGACGREHIRNNYRWDVILAKYERMFAQLRGQGRKTATRD